MSKLITICIPTLPVRYAMLARVMRELYQQAQDSGQPDAIEILTDDRIKITTGQKRTELYQKAQGKYISSVDDDDTVYPYYLQKILDSIEYYPDAVAMNGIMTTNTRNQQHWFISKDLPYDSAIRFDGATVYPRFHNHLSPIRAEIAKAYPFPDKSKYEDYDFAQRIDNDKAIKSEVIIGTSFAEWMNDNKLLKPEFPMYHYRFMPNKII